jgi:hypothetical protein
MRTARLFLLVAIAIASAPVVALLVAVSSVGHVAICTVKGAFKAMRLRPSLQALMLAVALCAVASFVVAELGWNKGARLMQMRAGQQWRGLDVTADPNAAGKDFAFHQKIAAAIQAARINPAQRVKHFAYLPGCDTPRGLIGWHGSIQHVERVPDGWLARVRIMPHLAGPGVCFTADHILEFYHYRPDGTVRLVSVTDPGPGRRGIVFCD